MQEDCSLIAEIAVWLLRLHSDCWDCSLIAEIAVWLLRLQSDCWDCSLILEVSQNRRTWNRGFPLVESPKSKPLIGWEDRIKKFKALAFCSEISLVPLISDCNLHNQTVIYTIRRQSRLSDSNVYNQTVISTIRLQSPQSDCKNSAFFIYTWSILRCLGDFNLLGCNGLYLAVLGYIKMYFALLGCTVLQWAMVGCSRLY